MADVILVSEILDRIPKKRLTEFYRRYLNTNEDVIEQLMVGDKDIDYRVAIHWINDPAQRNTTFKLQEKCEAFLREQHIGKESSSSSNETSAKHANDLSPSSLRNKTGSGSVKRHKSSSTEVMENLLNAKAKEISKINSPVATKEELDPVALQVMQGLDEIEYKSDEDRRKKWGATEDLSEGHYERCQDFYEQSSKSDIKMEELFDKAEESLKKGFSSKEDVVRKHRRVVSAVGQAGIGKTTLTKMLVRQVLNKMLLMSVQFIFFIEIRNIDFTKKMTLLNFLITSCALRRDDLTQIRFDDFFRAIKRKEDSLLLVFDGVDEAGQILANENPDNNPVDTDTEKSPGYWMLRIFNGDIFPDAYKLITSRPRALMGLKSFSPKFVVKVLGLNKTSQDNLIKQIVGDKFQEVKDLLKKHIGLSALCFVPVNCILTANCLKDQVESGTEDDVATITEVMFHCLEALFLQKGKDIAHCDLSGIARLAYNGLASESRRVVFCDQDIIDAKADANITEFFIDTKHTRLNTRVKIIDGEFGVGKTSNFSHLTWQEFFAAFHLMFFVAFQDFLEAMEIHLNSGRFEVVLQFMFGMCNPKYFDKVRFFQKLPCGDENKKKKSKLIEMTEKLADNSKDKIISICTWAYESRDEEIEVSLMKLFPEDLKVTSTFLPNDVTTFGAMLKRSTKRHVIDLCRVAKWREDGLVRFLKDFKEAILGNDRMQLTHLFLGDFPMTDEVVEQIPELVAICQHLALQICQITTGQIAHVMESVKRRDTKLERLIINDQRIEAQGFQEIAYGIHKAKRVGLRQTGLDAAGCLVIARECEKLEEPVERLHLKRNPIGQKGVEALSTCLHNVKDLILTVCGLVGEDMQPIGEALSRLQTPMNYLDLESNLIGNLGANYLAPGIGNVYILNLDACDIDEDGVKKIAKQLANSKRKMQRLSLKFNHVGDDASELLGKALKYVDCLEIDYCGISAKGAVKLSKGLAKLKKPMSLLSLNDNPIGSEGGQALLSNADKTMNLEMSNCCFDNGRLFGKRIKHPFKSVRSPIKSLNLSMNKICRADAEILSDNMTSIEVLHLSQCDLNRCDSSQDCENLIEKFSSFNSNGTQRVTGLEWQGSLVLSNIRN